MSEINAELQKEQVTKSRQEYELGGRKAEVITVTPEHIKKNPQTGEPVNPVFFQYGYGKEGAEMAKWFIETMAQEGRQAHAVRYLEDKPQDATTVQIDEKAQASRLDVEKAEDQIAIMKAMGISHADIVAESAGAPRAMLAANLAPDKFGNIVLVHPAGMDDRGYARAHAQVVKHQLVGAMHPKMLMERGKRWLRRRQIKKEMQQEHAEEHLPKNGGWNRSEQKAVAKARLDTLLPKLQESHPNLRVSMIGDKLDFNFKARRLEKINGASLFEFVTSKWNSHGIGHDSERVGEIDQLLTRMEKGEKKEPEPRKPKMFQRLLGRPASRERDEALRLQQTRNALGEENR